MRALSLSDYRKLRSRDLFGFDGPLDESLSLRVLIHFRQVVHVLLHLSLGLRLLGRRARTRPLLLAARGLRRAFAHLAQVEVDKVPHDPRLDETDARERVQPNGGRVEVPSGEVQRE